MQLKVKKNAFMCIWGEEGNNIIIMLLLFYFIGVALSESQKLQNAT